MKIAELRNIVESVILTELETVRNNDRLVENSITDIT